MNFNYCPDCGKQGTVKKLDDTNYECANCQWHFWNNAKAATTLVLVKDGKMLVSKRGREPRKGMYDLFGGFVDYGENAYQGAVREAKEELDIDIDEKDLHLIAIYHNDYNPGTFTTDIVFVVTKWRGAFTPNDEVVDLAWEPFELIHDPNFSQKFYTGLDKKLYDYLKQLE